MTEAISLTSVLSGLIGAVAVGGFTIWDRVSQRRQKKKSLEIAVRAHAKFLTMLVEQQDYEQEADSVAKAAKHPSWDGDLLTVDIPGHYLDGLKAAMADVGQMEPEIADLAVEFYHRAQIFIDSTRPTMIFHQAANLDAKRSHAQETGKNISALISVGRQLAGRK